MVIWDSIDSCMLLLRSTCQQVNARPPIMLWRCEKKKKKRERERGLRRGSGTGSENHVPIDGGV